MKNLSKLAVLTICLIITALFTSACGGGGKSTPPNNSALYYLLAQQNNQQENNNQQQENNNNENNNQQNNNNQQENNNQEENNNEAPAETSDITLSLAGLLNTDNIATADIFYSVDNTAKSTDEEDQEISKATPTAEDKTKFAVSLPANIDIANVKIKAIITYDSEGNLLDYFSSYDGVSAENGSFNINFENENGDFGGGTGTATAPYIISTPRHFANINKKDDQGDYLYLGKKGIYFKQDKDLDFTHLTGLKIVKAEDDKDITIETTNEKAPFYNNGEGNESIGKYGIESGNGSLHVIPAIRIPIGPTQDPTKNCFKGSYDGDNHTIDGLMFVNPQTPFISIFTIAATNKEPIKNLTIGKNSIFFIDKNNEIYNQLLNISPILNSPNFDGTVENSIENIENNAKIVVKNVETCTCSISGITGGLSNTTLTNCTNNGNITLINNKLGYLYANGIVNNIKNSTITDCTNTGNITITKTEPFEAEYTNPRVSGIVGDIDGRNGISIISKCTNNGKITVSENKKMALYCGGIIANLDQANISDLTNTGNITVTNNTDSYILYAYGVATMINTGRVTISGEVSNKGTITVTNNTNCNYINHDDLIGPETISVPVVPPTVVPIP